MVVDAYRVVVELAYQEELVFAALDKASKEPDNPNKKILSGDELVGNNCLGLHIGAYSYMTRWPYDRPFPNSVDSSFDTFLEGSCFMNKRRLSEKLVQKEIETVKCQDFRNFLLV